jgi:hypothetical protein
VSGQRFSVANGWIRDAQGRALVLRGVNFGGGSKVPKHGASFVGRPCELDEATEHCARLRSWGVRLLRLVTTWEALEHQPGQIDQAYLDYICNLVAIAAQHDLLVFVDPHQDVWSRATGGCGAPAWTLEAAGLRPDALEASGAALSWDGGREMRWPTNHRRLGCAAMFTAFWAGEKMLPGWTFDGEPVGRLLRRHYKTALAALARRLRGMDNVIGFGTLNEPGRGFVGAPTLDGRLPALFHLGPTPTPLEAMAAGVGMTVEVDVLSMAPAGPIVVGRHHLNPNGIVAWDARGCPFEQAGLWDRHHGRPRALRPDFFARASFDDLLAEFFAEVGPAVRAELPDALLFVEGEPFADLPASAFTLPGTVHAGHWYDGPALVLKSFDPEFAIDVEGGGAVFGRDAVRAHFAGAIGRLVARSHGAPLIVGEIGFPMDGSDRTAPTRALSAYYDALDAHLAGACLWSYNPDSTHTNGDGWNGEDFSVFSDGEGRALDGFCRPFPLATAGTPQSMSWDGERFVYRYKAEPGVSEIVFPSWLRVEARASSGRVEVGDGQVWVHSGEGVVEVTLHVRRV